MKIDIFIHRHIYILFRILVVKNRQIPRHLPQTSRINIIDISNKSHIDHSGTMKCGQSRRIYGISVDYENYRFLGDHFGTPINLFNIRHNQGNDTYQSFGSPDFYQSDIINIIN